MAAADGSIIIDVRANTQQAKSALTKLAKLAVTAFAVDKIIDFSKQAIQLGSDVAEVQNVVDVAFGDMSSAVDEFAQNAITNFGMSELAAKRTASTYMAMASNMGLSQAEAAEMSLTLTGLTGDVASFYNISQELADIKLKSVFTGETETLKDLGIVMTQANLEAFALSQGITKSISAMSQAELVTLRYNFVLDQLSLASGDFIRTQDSWANQTRILSMQWEEFMSIIGQSLIQVLLPVVQALNRIVSALIDTANAINNIIASLFGGASNQMNQTQQEAEGVGGAISGTVENQDDLTDAVEETNKEEKKSLAIFDEINKLSDENASEITEDKTKEDQEPSDSLVSQEQMSGLESRILKLLETVKRMAEEVKQIFQNIWSAIEDNVQAAVEKVAGAVGKIIQLFQDMWHDIASLGQPLAEWFNDEFIQFLQAFVDLCGIVISGLLDTFGMVFRDIWDIVIFPSLQKWVTDILPFLTELMTEITVTLEVLFEEVKRIFDKIWSEGVAPALELIQQIWADCWDSIIQAWETWGSPIFEGIREAIRNTADTLLNIWDTIVKPVWDRFLEAVKTIWDEHLKPLLDNILNMIGTLINNILRIYNEAILPIINLLVDTFGPVFVEAFNIIAAVVEPLLGGIIDFIDGIVTALTGLLGFVTGVLVGDWDLAWQGLKEIATGVLDAISGAFGGFVNGIISLFEGVVNFFVNGINAVINAVNSISFDVPDWIPLFGGGSFGFDIPNVPQLNLPRLAQGAVIPANREFLAVLGDQKSGTNIEAPTSEIEAAVARGIQRSGMNGGSGDHTVILQIGEQEMGRLVYRLNQQQTQRIGVRLAEG